MPVKVRQARELYRPAGDNWRLTLYRIMFAAGSRQGRLFDLILMVIIVASVLTVIIESVPALGPRAKFALTVAEWSFTILFTIEYLLRLACVRRPLGYAFSFYGIIDVIAILPTFLGFIVGAESLVVVRLLRLLRVFRLFKLTQFVGEAQVLVKALRASRNKITVFLGVVGIVVVIVGALMYIVEAGAGSGFDSIPKSMYWAVVTMTTVGYGDIAPKTSLGSMLAALLMLAGYGIIAVPTGIVTAELVQPPPDSPEMEARVSTEICPECTLEGHLHDALYCRRCGAHLDREDSVDEPEPEPEPVPVPVPVVTGEQAEPSSAGTAALDLAGEQTEPSSAGDTALGLEGEQAEPSSAGDAALDLAGEQAEPSSAKQVAIQVGPKVAEQKPSA